MLNEEI